MAEFKGVTVVFHGPSEGKTSSHTIYCKKHRVRQVNEATPPLLTLYSIGWPPFCSPADIETLFSRAGTVTSTHLQGWPGAGDQAVSQSKASSIGGGKSVEEVKWERRGEKGGGRVCYVVFSQPKEVEQALMMCSSGEEVRCDVGRVGLGKWCEDYTASRPRLDLVERRAEKCIGKYDQQQAAEQLVRKRLSEPDEEGWITVARKTPWNHPRPARLERKRRKQKELLNFYRFQQRETQREAIAELRKKFEMDKQKVAELRSKRKFRPF